MCKLWKVCARIGSNGGFVWLLRRCVGPTACPTTGDLFRDLPHGVSQPGADWLVLFPQLLGWCIGLLPARVAWLHQLGKWRNRSRPHKWWIDGEQPHCYFFSLSFGNYRVNMPRWLSLLIFAKWRHSHTKGWCRISRIVCFPGSMSQNLGWPRCCKRM